MKLFRPILLCTFMMVALLSVGTLMASDIHRELDDIAKRLTAKIEESQRTNVAVADFTDLHGSVSQLGRFVSEEISTNMVLYARGFSVIDRNHLRTILKEQKLGMSGLMDPENQKKLGKILGVDALILGTITPFGESYRLTFKVLATDTARVITADRGMVPKTPATDELWATAVAEDLMLSDSSASQQVNGAVASRPQILPQPKIGEYRNQYVSLVIESVSVRADQENLNIVARLTNVTKEDIYVAGGKMGVVDDAGVRWLIVRDGLVGLPWYGHGAERFNKHAGSNHHWNPDLVLSVMTPNQSQPLSISFTPSGGAGEAKSVTFSGELYVKVREPGTATKDKWKYTHFGIGISGIKLQ